MQDLHDLIAGSEDWLMQRVLDYAKAHDYTQYTSTLVEAWRLSIEGLSKPLLAICKAGGAPPEMSADDHFASDPSAEFGVLEARRHRERGITLTLFLGLFKYYRQAYVDLVMEAGLPPERANRYRYFVDRFFDRVELGFCAEWAASTEAESCKACWGVEFLYTGPGEAPISPVDDEPGQAKMAVESLARLPDALKNRLRQALAEGDVAEVDAAVTEVANHNASLAALLGDYASDFRFGEMAELLNGRLEGAA